MHQAALRFLLLFMGVCCACSKRSTPDTRPEPAEPAPATVQQLPEPAASAPEPPDTPAARADEYYVRRCMACHGATGLGDGPGAAMLKPAPRSFADAAWQKTVTDAYLADITVKGGAAVNKSRAMPPAPDLATDAELRDALIAKVRGFAK